MKLFTTLSTLTVLLSPLATASLSQSVHPNKVTGTWSLHTANSTHLPSNLTQPAFGDHPVGLLIFAPTLHLSEMLSVDPSTLPRFSSNESRTSGTPEQDAAVQAGTLAQIGTYRVNATGDFAGATFFVSTFPNWSGLTRGTAEINETVVEGGRYMRETLRDEGSETVITVWWKRLQEGETV